MPQRVCPSAQLPVALSARPLPAVAPPPLGSAPPLPDPGVTALWSELLQPTATTVQTLMRYEAFAASPGVLTFVLAAPKGED